MKGTISFASCASAFKSAGLVISLPMFLSRLNEMGGGCEKIVIIIVVIVRLPRLSSETFILQSTLP